ncbi:MAG: redoxin domain-containing protein [Verrucomicrobia bacterium]|nr:redoxin domain-containing protein [Verrucomicrobiota bacterium]
MAAMSVVSEIGQGAGGPFARVKPWLSPFPACASFPPMRALRFIATAGLALGLAGRVGAQSPELSLNRQAGPLRVGITGEIGRTYSLEAAPALNGTNVWTSLLTLTLTNGQQHWFDAAAAGSSQRFYRVAKLSGPAPMEEALNFRLIDHTGRSHELAYHTEARAVVLVFTGNGCAKMPPMLATIKSLRDQFAGQQVIFWLVDANAPDTRDRIAAEAANLGIDLPILHDDAQLVARAYHAGTTTEAIAIRTTDWRIFYRGAIDDRVGTNTVGTTQAYLADVLTQFLGNQFISLQRTVAEGTPIVFNPRPEVSYAADIAPLLIDRCVRCHSPGNIAPFALANYSVVTNRGLAIKRQVLAGEMPPWHADPRYGVFTNDAGLTPAQKALLVQWIDDGMPRGLGVDVLATNLTTTNYPNAWPGELGQPDYIVTIPLQNIPATGELPYQYPTIVMTNTSALWLRAAIIRPGNPRVVHHCHALTGVDSGSIASYNPGTRPVAYPSGTGRQLAAFSSVRFEIHYTPTGELETDQTQLGLYFAPAPPAMELVADRFSTHDITILPGVREYEREVQGTPSTTKDVWLYGMRPHMHYRGARFQYEALYPDSTTEVLLSVPKYDFHWQATYHLAQPKRLPAGTVLRVRGAFDNSPQNPHNPDPNATVYRGLGSEDEMFSGHFYYAVIP